MKALLLTRRSGFQYYCANTLSRRGHLHHVIFEEGDSFAAETPKAMKKGPIQLGKRILKDVFSSGLRSPWRIGYYLYRKNFYGNQTSYNSRILKHAYKNLDSAIPVIQVENINDAKTSELIEQIHPDIIYVFGTRLIRQFSFDCPVVNMHWGWSPNFRGEGIVSALAESGPEGLGVTIHMLAEEADAGDILYRSRPRVNATDNFYSIGLKLTRLGTDHFSECFQRIARGETLRGVPQDPTQGRLFTSKFFNKNPQYFFRAWRTLKSISSADVLGIEQ